MNGACPASTATSDILNHYTTVIHDVMVKNIRHCSARRAQPIRGFNPYRSQIIYMYMDYVSTVVEKDKCHCYRFREIS